MFSRALYDPSNHANEEMLAIQIGGLQTIYNNGNGDIYAGDLVLFDKPLAAIHIKHPDYRKDGLRKKIPGVPHEKLLFSVKRFNIKEFAGESVDANERHRIQQHVIGRALSTSKPGQPFDIILGRYCVG